MDSNQRKRFNNNLFRLTNRNIISIIVCLPLA